MHRLGGDRRHPVTSHTSFDEARVLSLVGADLLALIAARTKGGRSVWTATRVLRVMGYRYSPREHKAVIRHLDRVLRELVRSGHLVRRPEPQTSRNHREEAAFSLPPATFPPPTGAPSR